ncbi:MAG: Bifunctional protein GlmU [Holosporales bacterium]
MIGIIILAAGQGKRMMSSIPKVMHEVARKPMLEHVLSATTPLAPKQTLIVTSTFLKKYLDENKKHYTVDFVFQDHPLGTGHAVQCALSKLDPTVREVIILCGDTPLIKAETLKKLESSFSDLTLLSMKIPIESINQGYGRLIIENNQVVEIVEMKDATKEQKLIRTVNGGIYKISAKLLKETLKELTNHNEAKEYYLTDIVKIAHQKGYRITHIETDEENCFGVNSREELAKAEKLFQEKLRSYHMKNGATLIDPSSVFFEATTIIGKDVIIHPNVTFGKNVIIQDHVTIYSNCHIEESTCSPYSKIGPFAHLRGGCFLSEKAEVGNFVEAKKTTFGKGAKAKHLSYLGDATLGEKVNIGAGVITCNYNGFKKFKTQIENFAFIGSNTALIAPISIGENAIIGAGSTLTKDVPKNAISLTRPEQRTKEGAAITFKTKNAL